ncbi:MAG: RDD family protein [Actinomycetia bacterium]|nr:RDD family protein [Actinomycetes bacterium]
MPDPSAPGAAGWPLPPGTHYDPSSDMVLPNGVEVASPGRRIGGYFLEIGLAIITLGVGYVVWDLIVWARGQTPGKQVLHMRCMRIHDHRPANWGWMAMRQIVGGIVESIFAIFTFTVSSIMMIASRDHRAIHDHIAGTVVLHDPNGVFGPAPA